MAIEDPHLKKIDPMLLTAQEHMFIGSSPWVEGALENPFVPQIVLEKQRSPDSIEEANRLRAKLGELWSASGGFYYGWDNLNEPIIALSQLDSNGDVIDREPRLSGVQVITQEGKDIGTGELVRDPEKLKDYKLTDEGRKLLYLEPEGSPNPESEVSINRR